MAKSDGRLQSLGILLAMIAVIVAFFLKFQRRADEPLVTPMPRATTVAAGGSAAPTSSAAASGAGALSASAAAPDVSSGASAAGPAASAAPTVR